MADGRNLASEITIRLDSWALMRLMTVTTKLMMVFPTIIKTVGKCQELALW